MFSAFDPNSRYTQVEVDPYDFKLQYIHLNTG